jgi:hypothetical protein
VPGLFSPRAGDPDLTELAGTFYRGNSGHGGAIMPHAVLGALMRLGTQRVRLYRLSRHANGPRRPLFAPAGASRRITCTSCSSMLRISISRKAITVPLYRSSGCEKAVAASRPIHQQEAADQCIERTMGHERLKFVGGRRLPRRQCGRSPAQRYPSPGHHSAGAPLERCSRRRTSSKPLSLRSGRIEALIGLRMMPTFPRSPLSFAE